MDPHDLITTYFELALDLPERKRARMLTRLDTDHPEVAASVRSLLGELVTNSDFACQAGTGGKPRPPAADPASHTRRAHAGSMRFCNDCGSALEERTPDADDRPRKVCSVCRKVHYRNPLPVVGCLVERGDELLLCRRAIEPAYGRWTPPAGYLEVGEGLLAGARRETREEAGADVEITAPHVFLDVPHIGQTHALFRARLRTPHFSAGSESLEVAFVRIDEIPWTELAFPVVHFALELLREDRALGTQHVHHAVLDWDGTGSRYDATRYRLTDHLRLPLAPPRPS